MYRRFFYKNKVNLNNSRSTFRSFSNNSNPFGGIEDQMVSKLDGINQVIEVQGDVGKWSLEDKSIKQSSVIRSESGDSKSLILGFDEEIALTISTDYVKIGHKAASDERIQFQDLIVTRPTESGIYNFEQLSDTNNSNSVINLSKQVPKVMKNQITSSKKQVFTGNIAVDYTEAIGEGNYVLLEGKPNTGKNTLCLNTAANYLHDNGESATVVYFTLIKKNADQFQQTCEQLGQTLTFCPKYPERNSSVYLNLQTAIKTAIDLKQTHKKNVLLILENTKDIMVSIEGITSDLGLKTPFSNPFAALYDHTTTEKTTGASLTTILNFEEINSNDIYFVKLHKFYHSLVSECTMHIKTDLKKRSYRDVLPKIDLKIGNPYKFQWWYIRELSYKLRKLLLKIREQNEQISKMKEYGLHVDPWDAYLVYDSEYFLKMLLNKNYLTWQEQIVVLYFVHKSVEDDVISYYDRPQEEVIQDLLEFSQNTDQFNDGNIYDYLTFLRYQSVPEQGEISEIEDQLSWLVEMFFFEQKDSGKLLEYKKDYM